MPSLLYERRVDLWSLLNPPSDAAPEARRVLRALQPWLPRRRSSPLTLLELGCGVGHGTSVFAQHFEVTAVDRSPAMIGRARRTNPQVTHAVADMRTLRLGRTFDAVVCYDAVDHLATAAAAQQACRTIARHLRPRGVALVAPTYLQDNFVDQAWACDSARDEQHELAVHYLTRVQRRGSSTYDWIFTMILQQRGRLWLQEDRHHCGLFGRDQWLNWLRQAGLRVVREPGARAALGAFIAVRD